MKAVIVVLMVVLFAPSLALQGGSVHRPHSPPKLSLGTPVQVGCIALVPVLSQMPLSREKYITLSDAIKQGLAEVIEIPGREQVSSLEVKNRSTLPLLLLAGELLLGGKQDRIVGKNTVVPPRSSKQAPVFCVERGRWHGNQRDFADAGMLVNDEVRQAAANSDNQEAVWDKVADTNARAGKSAATETIQATLSDPEIHKRIGEVASKLFAGVVGDPDTVGVICVLNGKIHSADLFSNHALFAASGLKVIKSYAADAELLQEKKNLPPDIKACEEFLQAIVSSERIRREGIFYLRGKVTGFESGSPGFGGGLGAGFAHGNYKPGVGVG